MRTSFAPGRRTAEPQLEGAVMGLEVLLELLAERGGHLGPRPGIVALEGRVDPWGDVEPLHHVTELRLGRGEEALTVDHLHAVAPEQARQALELGGVLASR